MASYTEVGASALATGTTTVLPVYASATAGNLLVACVTSQMTTPASFTLSGATTGWNQGPNVGSTNIECEIWWKVAVGSDTMPTWNISSGSQAACIVAEFHLTGFSNHTLDQQGTLGGVTTSPRTVTASGTDGGTGRLIVFDRIVRLSSAGVNTTSTDNINGAGVGTGVNVLADQTASATSHHHSGYTLASTTGSSADSDVATWTATTTHAALCIASFIGSSTTTAIVGEIDGNGAVAGTLTVSGVYRVQSWGNPQSVGTTLTATSGAAISVGNMLLAIAYGINQPAISDNLGNTWIALPNAGLTNNNIQAWYSIVTTGGTDTVTITASSLASAVSVLEVAGEDQTNPIDEQAANGGLSGTASTGATPTPTYATDLAVGLVGSTGTAEPSGRAFSPALASQSDETVQSPNAPPSGVAISDGPMTGANATTFTTTNIATRWAAWIVLIQPPEPVVGIDASISGAGAVAGTLTVSVALSGAIAANGAVAAGNAEAVALTGAISANGAVAGTATELTRLSGAIAGTGAVAGSNKQAVALAGAVAGNGSVAATLTVRVALGGSISATGTVTGAAINQLFLTGAIAATGAVAGSGAEAVAISGAISATGAVAGTLTVAIALVGEIDANGAVSGSTALPTIAAEIDGVGAISGSLSLLLPLSAAISAGGTVGGNVVNPALLGSISAQGALLGRNPTPITAAISAQGAFVQGKPQRVQFFGGTASTPGFANTVTAGPATVTVGDLLIAVVILPASLVTISDTLANTWVNLPIAGGSAPSQTWYSVITTGGLDTVSVATSDGSLRSPWYAALSVLEVSGSFDSFVGAQGFPGPVSSGPSATPAAAELVVGLATLANSISLTNSFSPALQIQTDEWPQEVVVSGNTFATLISDGPMNSAVATTFNNASFGGWVVWEVLVSGGIPNVEHVAISGAIAASGALAGNAVPGNAPLNASISGLGTVAATNGNTIPLSATIAGNGAVQGIVAPGTSLSAGITANGAVFGIEGNAVFLSASISGHGAVAGVDTYTIALLGLIAATGTVAGSAANHTPALVAAIGAIGAINGYLSVVQLTAGVANAVFFPVTSCNGLLGVSGASGILAVMSPDGTVQVNGRDGLLTITSATGDLQEIR